MFISPDNGSLLSESLPPVQPVNPNTMQRALSELERTGLVYSQRTSGRFITEDTAMIEGLKQQIAEEKIHDFFEAMKHLGISKEETLQLIQQHTTI